MDEATNAPVPVDGASPSDAPSARQQTRAILLLAALVAALALLLTGIAEQGDLPRVAAIHPLVILGMVVLAEAFPIQIELRRESHTYTLVGVALVLGAFTVGPLALIATRVAGSAIVKVLQRQDRTKMAINVASYWFDASLTLVLLSVVAPVDPMQPRGWLAVLAVVAISDLAQGVVITMAITMHTGRFAPEDLAPGLLPSVAAVFDGSIGLAALVLQTQEPRSVFLLSALPVVLVFAYRAQANLRASHTELGLLYDFTRSMSKAWGSGGVMQPLLHQTAEVMHAEKAWLFLRDDETGAVSITSYDAATGIVEARILETGSPDLELHVAAATADDGLVVRTERSSVRGIISSERVLLAPLRGSAGRIGTLAVGDRSGSVRVFDDDDLRLFTTLANQAAIAIENGALIDRLRTESALNEHQALHDSLTGLANRVLFDRKLTSVTEAGRNAAVLLLDLDGFKDVNDTLGHHQGDQLLILVAERLQSLVRGGDLIARLGGDEFAILLSDVTAGAQTANRVADHLRDDLRSPFSVGGLDVAVGASIGIAFYPDDADTAGELLQRADVAMYVAKETRSGYECYDRRKDNYSPERLALVTELRDAVERGEIEVHYQPQIDLQSGAVVGVEALARWKRADGTNVPPDVFIEAAERAGVIGALTRHVVDAAIGGLADLRERQTLDCIAINLSPRNLTEPTLVKDLVSITRDRRVNPSDIRLEITETSAMADPEHTLSTLNALRDAGFELAIDDFGTGYSSLSYLQRFPVREVKIDRSFVTDMASDASDAAIVQSVVDLGRNLGLDTVAEGVENALTLGRLRAMGCVRAQGYFIARPMPGSELGAWMEAWDARDDLLLEAAPPPTVHRLPLRSAGR